MGTLLTSIGSFITSAISWMTTYLGSFTGLFTDPDNPGGSPVTDVEPVLFLFVVAIPLVGLGIGLLSRLIKTRG